MEWIVKRFHDIIRLLVLLTNDYRHVFPLITIAFAKGGDSKVDVVIHLSLEIRCSYMRYK